MFLQILRKYLQQTDEELVEKYQNSMDSYYLGVLFKRYNEMTVSLAYNYLKNEHDAEDAVMECYELLHKELKKTTVKNFGGWYYSVVRNHLLKIKRKRAKEGGGDELIEGYHDRAEEDSAFQKLFNDKESKIAALVKEILKELKPDQEKCVRLFYMEGLKYKEIEEKTGLPNKKVKSHIQNGKRKLLIELEKRNVKSIHEIL